MKPTLDFTDMSVEDALKETASVTTKYIHHLQSEIRNRDTRILTLTRSLEKMEMRLDKSKSARLVYEVEAQRDSVIAINRAQAETIQSLVGERKAWKARAALEALEARGSA